MPVPFRLVAIAALWFASGLSCGVAADSSLPRNLHAELNPPPVAGVVVRDVTATSAEIEWPASLSTATAFRVEGRRFSLGEDRELRMDWVEWREASVARHGEHFRARLRGLTPRQPYWLRVLPQTASEPIFAVRFETPAKQPIFTAWRLTIGALVVVLAALLWLRWRR